MMINNIITETFNKYSKVDLQSINDRIYELIGTEMLSDDDEEDYLKTDEFGRNYVSIFDKDNNEFDSIEDYNSYILENAIDEVLKDLKNQLLQAWGIK